MWSSAGFCVVTCLSSRARPMNRCRVGVRAAFCAEPSGVPAQRTACERACLHLWKRAEEKGKKEKEEKVRCELTNEAHRSLSRALIQSNGLLLVPFPVGRLGRSESRLEVPVFNPVVSMHRTLWDSQVGPKQHPDPTLTPEVRSWRRVSCCLPRRRCQL